METSEVAQIPFDFGLSVKEHKFQIKKCSIVIGRGEQKSYPRGGWNGLHLCAEKGFCKENRASEWLLSVFDKSRR